MPPNHIPQELLDILICPNCLVPLDHYQGKALLCKNCSSQYDLSDSGNIDLRLKNPKRVNLDFTLGDFQPSNIPAPKGYFTENQHPEFIFDDTEIPHHLSKELMSYFPKAKSKNYFMLNLGCGDASHKNFCQQTGFQYVGLDYSHPKAPIWGDAHALPFRDESFEFILSIAVFEHIQYPFVMIKEAARVLRKDGVLIGTVSFQEPFHGNSYYHHSHLGLHNLLSYGGFKVEQLAPSKSWQVFDAQARMAGWAMFPGIPRFFAAHLIKFPQLFSNCWLKILKVLKPGSLSDTRAFINSGAFSFVARK